MSIHQKSTIDKNDCFVTFDVLFVDIVYEISIDTLNLGCEVQV